jgi:hypothetical protein
MTIPAFDIFPIDSDENPRWLEAVRTLAEAERRARELATPTYARCLILTSRRAKSTTISSISSRSNFPSEFHTIEVFKWLELTKVARKRQSKRPA